MQHEADNVLIKKPSFCQDLYANDQFIKYKIVLKKIANTIPLVLMQLPSDHILKVEKKRIKSE
jgi:hypothetical protein